MDSWRDYFLEISDELTRIASSWGDESDKKNAKADVEYLVQLRDLQGSEELEPEYVMDSLAVRTIDDIRKLPIGVVASKLSISSPLEIAAFYGAHKVPRWLARERAQNATTIERGLIKVFYPDIQIKQQEIKKESGEMYLV